MISVVIPVFDEGQSLESFYKELLSTLKGREYEIIFIDDGSKDNSLNILKNFRKNNKSVRIFSFRRNQGKAEVLTFGFEKAKGEYIVTLDADLQDKPSEIPKLLKKIEEGWNLVCGWRRNRKDPIFKVLSSRLFNLLVSFLWGSKLHDYNCGLKVYTKDAAKNLRLYGGMHRFIPLLAYQEGFMITEVEVEHQSRKHGKSKYGLSKIWRDIPDMFTMLFLMRYRNRPLHFFGFIGASLLIIGILILGYLSVLRFEGEVVGRRPLLFFGMLLVLSGLQVFFTGFLADLMINLSQNNSKEPLLKYSSDQ